MDREFCIDYILDECLDCPERVKNGECQTESHCCEVKQKIMADLRKLDKIERIIDETNRRESVLVNPGPKITVRSMGFDKIREVLKE